MRINFVIYGLSKECFLSSVDGIIFENKLRSASDLFADGNMEMRITWRLTKHAVEFLPSLGDHADLESLSTTTADERWSANFMTFAN